MRADAELQEAIQKAKKALEAVVKAQERHWKNNMDMLEKIGECS